MSRRLPPGVKALPPDDTGTGTPFTWKQLHTQSVKAGKSLFDDDQSGLLHGGIAQVSHRDLRKRIKSKKDDESNVSTFEYIFNPHTGKGFDYSDMPIKDVPKEYYAKDGNLYTYSAEDNSVNVHHPQPVKEVTYLDKSHKQNKISGPTYKHKPQEAAVLKMLGYGTDEQVARIPTSVAYFLPSLGVQGAERYLKRLGVTKEQATEMYSKLKRTEER